MTAVLLFGIAGCRNDKVDIRELQKNKGVMLEIRGNPQEAMPLEDYQAVCFRMVQTVYYDGTAYNADSLNTPGIKMTDEDYLKIYNFCMDNIKNNKFSDYSEDVCDGDTYTFTYYDVDGNPTPLTDDAYVRFELLTCEDGSVQKNYYDAAGNVVKTEE